MQSVSTDIIWVNTLFWKKKPGENLLKVGSPKGQANTRQVFVNFSGKRTGFGQNSEESRQRDTEGAILNICMFRRISQV